MYGIAMRPPRQNFEIEADASNLPQNCQKTIFWCLGGLTMPIETKENGTKIQRVDTSV